MGAKKLARYAVLIALALGLSYMERFIPLELWVPLPGVKLGLANIVTLFALYDMGGRSAAAILLPRCLLGAVFGGSGMALLYSLMGGFLALGVMTLARRLPPLSVLGVSILGAAAHNCGQILAAMLVLRSVYIISYLPFLLFTSVATGFLTGSLTAASLRAVWSAEGRKREERDP